MPETNPTPQGRSDGRTSSWTLLLTFGVPALGIALFFIAERLGGCKLDFAGKGPGCPAGLFRWLFLLMTWVGVFMSLSLVLAPFTLIAGAITAGVRGEKW